MICRELAMRLLISASRVSRCSRSFCKARSVRRRSVTSSRPSRIVV